MPDLSAYGDARGDAEPTSRTPVADAGDRRGAAPASTPPRWPRCPTASAGTRRTMAVGEVAATFTFSAEQRGAGRRRGGRGPAARAARSRRRPGPADRRSRASPRSGRSDTRRADARRRPCGRPGGLRLGHRLRGTCATTCSPCPACRTELATQLRSFSPDARRCPLPVPAELVTSSTAEVERRRGDPAHLPRRALRRGRLGGGRRDDRRRRVPERGRGPVGRPRLADAADVSG